jgi:hypothetical protein
MSGHDDYEVEPVPGLPALLPEDETLLWQGGPEWKTLAWRAFHLRFVMAYFGLLIAWTGFSTWWVGGGWTMTFRSVVPISVAAILAIGLLAFLAWLAARSSVYTITSKRVIMRVGVALPVTFNLPFTCIDGASVRRSTNGSGDISLAMGENKQLNAFMLWPHARPWHLRKPEPSLRAIANLDAVANVLSQALKAAIPEGEASPIAPATRPTPLAQSTLIEASSFASAAR